MSTLRDKLMELRIDEKKIKDEIDGKMEEAEENIRDEKKMRALLDKALSMYDQLTYVPIIGDIFSDFRNVCELVSNYVHGKYRRVPVIVIIALTAAIIYFVSPLDLIPDFIPVIGRIDDATVFGMFLRACSVELEKYQEWKAEY